MIQYSRVMGVKILLIEDNEIISKGLLYTLGQNGYEVVLCDNIEKALMRSGEDFDLMIIDVTLPDGNGFDFYERVKRYNPAPAIFLTALDDEDNIVKGFELGAEDYITKPFSPRELIARIKRIERRNRNQDLIKWGNIAVNTKSSTVTKDGEEITLTALEYKIFSMLLQNVGNTVKREVILERIWDISGNFVNDNTLTVYIKRIRKKLDTDKIKTIKGIGYRLEKI